LNSGPNDYESCALTN